MQTNPIQKLSPDVIGQIAAGEVVERPASAVKELVENSIDAGADAITVELREGGIAYLRVSDNGRGIPASQIRMAFERHATSKITRPEDLFDIHTLGFRGEALASIAAVSKVTLTTRTAAEDFGVRAKAEAGQILDVREAAAPVGTTILVQELFFNTPVRLKFLKKPAVEASLVSDYMMRLILSRPDIAFRLVSQGKTVYRSVGDGSLENALYCVLGKDAMRQMKKVHGVMNGLILDGYVGAGELSRGNRQLQSFFVNGRYFRDAALSKALENACQGLVMAGRFPCCALYLQLPYQQVDVNVHPNKLEVRFQNLPQVAQAVETLVREAVRSESLENRLAGGEHPEHSLSGYGGSDAGGKKEEQFRLVMLGEETGGELASEPSSADMAGETLDSAEKPGWADTRSAPTVMPHGFDSGGCGETSRKTNDPRQDDHTSAVETDSLKEALAGLTPVKVAMPGETPWLKENYAFQRSVLAAGGGGITQTGGAVQAEEYAMAAETVFGGTAMPDHAAPHPRIEQETFLQHGHASSFRLIGIAFQTYWLFEAGDRLLWVDQHAAHERILYDRLWKQYESEHTSQRLLAPLLMDLTARECALVEELKPVMEAAGFDVEPFDATSVAVHAIPTVFGKNESPRELLLEALDEWQSQRGQVTRERMRRRVMQMACKKAIKAGDALTGDEISHLLSQMLTSGIMPTCPHGRPIVVEVERREMEKRFRRS